jgi:drug/metabolite transporter (DMT)-like permease
VTRGLWLGAVAVLMFALTIPMTRLATGPAAAGPGVEPLPADFVALGRAAVAGLLALAYLLAGRGLRWADVHGQPWGMLALTAAGVVFGWPLCLGWAITRVDATHAAMVTGVLPLATAALGALWQRQPAGGLFWACALTGTALVLAFAAWRGGGGWHLADGLLLLAVLLGAVGYVSGAHLSRHRSPQEVIAWVLVGSLPLTLPLAWWLWPQAPATWLAWSGFAYVSVFSMGLGFVFWYRALALGGTVRVSQVQLLQPFASMLLAVPLLGEVLDGATLAFALAILAVVVLGRYAAARPAGHPGRAT